ncbi:MAG: transcription antitermination factor NusB, partial [Hydrogenophaga sp.]|nr:transcription antitermination factor NusB [Hydrogenophaga sp.]
MTASASPPAPRPPGALLGPSLATQLRQTARCVHAVEQGQSLSDVLPQVSAELRPGVQALTFHVLRHLGTARALVAQLVQRKPDAAVQALLCSALSLMLEDAGAGSSSGLHYAAHTVVNQAVDAARQDRGTARQAAFINACLRRFLRERPARSS